MTTVTDTPAQAAQAGGAVGRPPASPPLEIPSSKSGAASERKAPSGEGTPRSRPRSGGGTTKTKHKTSCGRTARQSGGKCELGRGWGTDHPGVGACKFHGGSSPTGKKNAEREKVKATLAHLAIPAEGDPLEVLQAAVEAAHGVLLASRELVKGAATDVTLKLYLEGIERAAKVAKAAAEAINLDELVRIREREADLLEMALTRALERSGMPKTKQAGFLVVFREELRGVLPEGPERN